MDQDSHGFMESWINLEMATLGSDSLSETFAHCFSAWNGEAADVMSTYDHYQMPAWCISSLSPLSFP